MFTQISWGSYITIVAVLIAGYYFFVGFRYYRNDLLQLLSGKKISVDKVSFTATQRPHKENLQEAFEKQNFFQLAQSLSDEIQAFVNASAGDKLNKDEVMNGLRGLLGKYPALKDSSFTEFIQNIIISESESNLSILLSPEEAAALWI